MYHLGKQSSYLREVYEALRPDEDPEGHLRRACIAPIQDCLEMGSEKNNCYPVKFMKK